MESFVPSNVSAELPPERSAGVPFVDVQYGIRVEVSAEEVATLPEPPPPDGQVVRQVSPVRQKVVAERTVVLAVVFEFG